MSLWWSKSFFMTQIYLIYTRMYTHTQTFFEFKRKTDHFLKTKTFFYTFFVQYNPIWVVAIQRCFIFIPKIGKMIQFDEHIFERGWFNHQLAIISLLVCIYHRFFWIPPTGNRCLPKKPKGEAQAALQSARAMGMEAASEPRFWKLFLGIFDPFFFEGKHWR